MEMSFYENHRDERDMRQTLLKRKMESPLTRDNSMNGERDAVDKLKKAMKLDFNSSGNKQSKLSLLQSPDLNMLKLASPELEKMIIQANGLVTTTPTPTQFIFPKYVTDEQEAYARGFVDALAELHGTPSEPATKVPKIPSSISLSAANMTKCSAPTSNSSVNLTYTTVPSSLSTTTSLPGGLLNVVVPRTVESIHNFGLSKVHIKEEPQTVPCLDSSPPLSPIDMDTQEVFKLERKRARNRVAARKCRTRKLERISKLEDKVSDLKGQNTDLSTTANNLRDQVCKLKKQIIDHVSSGCQIMMAPNF